MQRSPFIYFQFLNISIRKTETTDAALVTPVVDSLQTNLSNVNHYACYEIHKKCISNTCQKYFNIVLNEEAENEQQISAAFTSPPQQQISAAVVRPPQTQCKDCSEYFVEGGGRFIPDNYVCGCQLCADCFREDYSKSIICAFCEIKDKKWQSVIFTKLGLLYVKQMAMKSIRRINVSLF